jgi:hypothetical protein
MHPVNSLLCRTFARFCGLLIAFVQVAHSHATEIPAASWATFLTGAREGVLSPKILPNPAGGFYLYASGDIPLTKFNADDTIAWQVRQEPGVNDVREVAQLDIMDNGDLIAIVAAASNARVFGSQFVNEGRFLVRLRGTDAAPIFVKSLENCWLTAVKARPGGGYLVGGANFGLGKIGTDPLPFSSNRVFVAQFTTSLDWAASGDWTDFSDSVESIRTTGTGASLQIWAAGYESHAWTFGGKSLPKAGVYVLTLGPTGEASSAQVVAPDQTFCAFELRPGGGAYVAAQSGAVSDLWRMNAGGGLVWHVSLNGTVAAVTATDEPYVIGSTAELRFLASFDGSGNQKWLSVDEGPPPHTGTGAAVLSDGRLAIAGVSAPGGLFIDDFFLRDISFIGVTPYEGYVAVLETSASGAPVIRMQPRDQILAVRGETLTLHTEIYSPSGAALEWHKNGNIMAGQTSPDLVLPNAQGIDSGTYFLEARNAAGLTRSTSVSVVVNSITVSVVAGTDTSGAFDSPRSPIVLLDGSLLVADSSKHVIKRVTSTGVTTFAGKGESGFADGAPLEAMFSSPSSLALEWRYEGPIIYVADRGNNRLRRVRFSTETGEALTVEQLPGAFAQVNSLATLDGLKTVAAANGALVWKYDEGAVNFSPVTNSSGAISALAFDKRMNLYVADSILNEIRRVSPGGRVETVATQLGAPSGMAIDDSGNIYVTERASHSVRKIGPNGTKTLIAGSGISGFANGGASLAMFSDPEGLCIRNGILIVADTGNHCLREIRFTPLSNSDAGPPEIHVSIGNALSLSVSTTPGATFTIESSAQLGPAAQWKNEGTVTAGSGAALTLSKPGSTRFYRARQ